MDDALPPELDRRPVGAHGDDLAAGRGPPMDDALRPVDLDRRPVGLHGGDLAPEMAARSGEGRLWMMRCPPSSIVAQSAPMATILLPDEGRLWMMRCAPLISIVAQSVCMAV